MSARHSAHKRIRAAALAVALYALFNALLIVAVTHEQNTILQEEFDRAALPADLLDPSQAQIPIDVGAIGLSLVVFLGLAYGVYRHWIVCAILAALFALAPTGMFVLFSILFPDQMPSTSVLGWIHRAGGWLVAVLALWAAREIWLLRGG